MFDSLFGPSYDSYKLKVQLKLAVSRIQILKNKKANIVRDEKRNVAELLKNKNEESARIRVETIIRDEYLIECFQIIEVLCELLHARINLINATTEMPIEMKESIFTLVYSSQRVQIPELEQIKNQLKAKYGRGLENDANCHCSTHVNPKIVHKLSYITPDPSLIFQYLSEIAEKYNIEWCSDFQPVHQIIIPSPPMMHHQPQQPIIQQQPQQEAFPQIPAFPIMSPPQQPSFSQIQHQQQIQQQYQQQNNSNNNNNQQQSFPSAPPSFSQIHPQQSPQFPSIPTNNNNNMNNNDYNDNNNYNNYNNGNNNNNNNNNMNNNDYNDNNNYNNYKNGNNNNNNNNNNMPPPYQPSSNLTSTIDYDELTKRFEALKKSNDY